MKVIENTITEKKSRNCPITPNDCVFNQNQKVYTMKQFLLLLHEDLQQLKALTPQEMEQLAHAHMAWAQELAKAGHLIAGDGLKDTSICISGKEATIKDGPYIESKEIIGGYYLLQAQDLETVIQLAKQCPTHFYGGTTEIRPIMDMDEYAQ
jgi:hypothetical protein